jgi:hypothetical protein
VERALAAFKRQPDALAQCRAALDSLMAAGPMAAMTAAHQYVVWHALGVVEYWAEFRMGVASAADAAALRDWLFAYAARACEPVRPAFLATKALKCVVALARSCWPRLLPTLFFGDVLSGALPPQVALRVIALASEELCGRLGPVPPPAAVAAATAPITTASRS